MCPERCPDASLIDGKKGGIDSWRATDSRFVNVSYVGDGVVGEIEENARNYFVVYI